jgi:hypothetical protein
MNKQIAIPLIALLAVAFSDLHAQRKKTITPGFLGRKHQVGINFSTAPAINAPMTEDQLGKEGFNGIHLRFGGSYHYSPHEELRIGLGYDFEQMATPIYQASYSSAYGATKASSLSVHTISFPVDAYFPGSFAPIGLFFRIQPELVFFNMVADGALIFSPGRVEAGGALFGLGYWVGNSFSIRNRITFDISIGTSQYLPRIFSEPDYHTMVDKDGYAVSAAALRLFRARMIHLRVGVNYLF